MLSSRASRCLSSSNLLRVTRSSFSSQIRAISSVFKIGPTIYSPNPKMPTILPDNKPDTSLWMNHFSTSSNKGSINSKTGLSRPLLLLFKSGISTYTGIVASSTSTQDSQVNNPSAVAPQKFDLSQLPEAARGMFTFPWKSPEIQQIVYDELRDADQIPPEFQGNLDKTIKEAAKLIGIKWNLFSNLKTRDEVYEIFDEGGVNRTNIEAFFMNIATKILQIVVPSVFAPPNLAPIDATTFAELRNKGIEIGKTIKESDWRDRYFAKLSPGLEVVDRPLATEQILKQLHKLFNFKSGTLTENRDHFCTFFASVASGTGKSTYFANCLSQVLKMAQNDGYSQDFLACLEKAQTVYIEFNGRGDSVALNKSIDRVEVALLLRLFARAIMGLPFKFIRNEDDFQRTGKYSLGGLAEKLELDVMLDFYFTEMRKEKSISDDQPAILIVHIDEYQMFAEENNGLKELSRFLSSILRYSETSFSATDNKTDIKNRNIILPIVTGTALKPALELKDLSTYRVVPSQFTHLNMEQSLSYLESRKEFVNKLTSESYVSQFDRRWRGDVRYRRAVGDAGGVIFILEQFAKKCTLFNEEPSEQVWNSVLNYLALVLESVSERYPQNLSDEAFARCLNLSLTREKIDESTSFGIYSLDKLSRQTGIVLIPTDSPTQLKMSVSPILYPCYSKHFTKRTTLFDMVFKFPYNGADGSMLEGLIMATLMSRIDNWIHDGAKQEFSLVEFFGLNSLTNNGDPFKRAFSTTVDENIRNMQFPVKRVGVFQSLEDLKGQMRLSPLNIPGSSNSKVTPLFQRDKHLIIDCGQNNRTNNLSFIDILVILHCDNAKSLVIAIQTKDLGSNSKRTSFDLHERSVKALDALREVFSQDSFNHLILFASTLSRNDALEFNRRLQNGGEVKTTIIPNDDKTQTAEFTENGGKEQSQSHDENKTESTQSGDETQPKSNQSNVKKQKSSTKQSSDKKGKSSGKKQGNIQQEIIVHEPNPNYSPYIFAIGTQKSGSVRNKDAFTAFLPTYFLRVFEESESDTNETTNSTSKKKENKERKEKKKEEKVEKEY